MTKSRTLNIATGLIVAAGLTAGTLTATTAEAATRSSLAESRGYQNCVEAAGREVRLIKTQPNYYIYEHAESRSYYLNGYGFRDGDSEAIRIACSTIPSGNRVLEVSVDLGSYAGRVVDAMNVARN